MSFFKLSSDNKLIFGDKSKYRGKTVDEVIKMDPQYVRFARREFMGGLPPSYFDLLDDVFRTSGVPFVPKKEKKPSPRRKS